MRERVRDRHASLIPRAVAGRGAYHILERVGRETLARSLSAVASGGRIFQIVITVK